jgi:hypothetical protein
MDDKKQIMSMLKEEFDRWVELLAGLSEEQITDPSLPAYLSTKNVVAHLWAWQQRSIAWMEAALKDTEPDFPRWPETREPETDDDLDRMNAWIYETYRDKPWSSVYKDWRDGFLRFMELAEKVPEKDLLEPGRYGCLDGYPLTVVLEGSYEHHHIEHFEPLVAWLKQNGDMKVEG